MLAIQDFASRRVAQPKSQRKRRVELSLSSNAVDFNPTLIGDHACWHTYSSRSIWNIVYYYGIRSNPCMVSYRDRPQYFSSRTNVYMTADFGCATIISTNSYLLK
jgi:hypothetical protein